MSVTGDHDFVEPIAIVGMAMRFPGGSHSSEQFWGHALQRSFRSCGDS